MVISNTAKITVLFFFTIILIVLTLTSLARNSAWHDEITLLEDNVEKAPHKPRGHLRLGCADYVQSRIDEAIGQFEIGLQITPNDAYFYNNLGLAYERKGDFALAAEMYNKAIALSPNFTDAFVNRCYFRIQRNEIPLAIEDCDRAIILSPLRKEAYGNRGIAYSMIGQYDAAMKDFERTISIDPQDQNAYLNLGLVLFKAGMYEKELDLLSKVIVMYPNFAKAYSTRGTAYLYLGNVLKAAADFREACAMGDSEACNSLR
jgi:tetratricopeptide (TPR) repeat protein